jgi:hypothetical protein
MSVTITGYLQGRSIVLGEDPIGLAEGPVQVTVSSLPAPSSRVAGYMRRGMFKKPGVPASSWEDLQDAKREWDSEHS